MKIYATPCSWRDLSPGDLFSHVGQEHFDHLVSMGTVRLRVHVRSDVPVEDIFSEPNETQGPFKITIEKENKARNTTSESNNKTGAEAGDESTLNVYFVLGEMSTQLHDLTTRIDTLEKKEK